MVVFCIVAAIRQPAFISPATLINLCRAGIFTMCFAICEMIVIIYDIFFAYVDDIRQAHCKGDHDGQKDAIRNAQSVLDELIGSLNFSYPISHNLYKLYMFCKNELSRAMYENRLDGVQEAEHIMHRLYTSFVEVAKQDKSAPLMKNTQQVYAGMTYARGAVNEDYMDVDSHRGFFV
jgi:flagellar protein FliS